MSCLRTKLFPVKRVWKSIANKFHKLKRSKTKLQTRYGASASAKRCSGKNLGGRDSSVLLLIRLKRGCLFKKKRKYVVYVHKRFRETIWIPAKQWKPEKEMVLPEKGIDERAQDFINRMKAEMIAAARNS